MKVFYLILMVITGMVIPVMASLNSALSAELKSVFAAVLVFFIVALAFAVSLLLIIQGSLAFQPLKMLPQVPVIYLLGGIGIVVYITSVSFVGPKVGIGTSLAFVLLGQLISMIFIDHFAFLEMPQAPISWRRLAGVGFMLVGITFVLFPSTNS